MNRGRLAILLGLVVGVSAAIVVPVMRSRPAAQKVFRVFDRRCRGGCTDTALLRILPGGSGPIATGALSGSKGQTVTTTRASNKTCTKADGTLVYLGSNQPCVETAGVLVEGASTNVFLQSSALDNAAWSLNGTAGSPIVTANACVGPDGTATGETVAYPAVGAGQTSQLFQSVSVTSATSYTETFYVKGVGSSGTVYLNVQSAGNSGDSTCSFTSTGFARCSMSFLAGGTNSAAFVIGVSPGIYPGTENPQPAQTLCITDAQVEASPFATSYIPTTSATASRASDLISTPNPLPNSSAPWCVYETVTPESGRAWTSLTGNVAMWSFGAYAAANSAWGQVHSNGNIYMTVYDSAGGSVQGSSAYSFMNGTSHRIGQCNTAAGGQQFYFDGVSQGVGVGGTGTGVTSGQSGNFYLGSQSLGGFQVDAYISDVCLGAPGSCK
jgi:hypothetical protein